MKKKRLKYENDDFEGSYVFMAGKMGTEKSKLLYGKYHLGKIDP